MEEYKLNKLKNLINNNIEPYINTFKVDHPINMINKQYKEKDPQDLLNKKYTFTTAGRIVSIRKFGKAAFLLIKDRTGEIQVYIKKNNCSEVSCLAFDNSDIGDFIGIFGYLFKTRTGELTIFIENYQLLTKSLDDLPEKWHGLKDIEKRYRQRYLDLLINKNVKDIFIARDKIIREIRAFFSERDFIEVETPMMQPIAGGATAKPFTTYHSALDMKLYLRIAPELYLKRLVIGGMERVFEINRNFRNEGISTRHNPEFTMIEWYIAYADYNDLMNMTEDMVTGISKKLLGSLNITYNNHSIDFTPPWSRLTLFKALEDYTDFSAQELSNIEEAKKIALNVGIKLSNNLSLGKIQVKLFEKLVEDKLIQPTFILDYPKDISPLSKASKENPDIAERFELFIGGMEIANGFNELNDPIEQRKRFEIQINNKDEDNENNKTMDEDFIKALEYGLPPTSGEGLGIDRLIMLFTNSASIREVILFPQLKKQETKNI